MSENPTYEELVQRIYELEQEASEFKKAECKLQESESRLRKAQQLAHMGNWFWDVNSGKVEWSNEVFNIFGLDPKKFTPQIDSILELSPWPEDQQRDKELIQKATESGEIGSYEQRFLKPDGSIGYYFSNFQGVYDDKGKLTAINGVVHDITERKKVEDALMEGKFFLDTLINAIPIPVFYKDKNGRYLGFNTAFESFFGKNREDLIGKSVFDINPKHFAEIYHAKDIELFKSNGKQKYESQVKNACGQLREVIFNKSVYKDKRGSTVGLIGAILDITERKRSEQRLKDSEKTFKAIFDDANDGILVSEVATKKFVMANTMISHMLGFAKAELSNMSVSDIHPQEELPSILAIFEKQANKKIKVAENLPVKRKDGTIFYADISTSPVTIGSKPLLVGIFRDITDRKKAEEALLESEQRFRVLFESSKDANYISTIEGHIIDANQSFLELFGYDKEELHYLSTEDLYINPNDRDLFINEVNRNGFAKDFEEKLRDKNGNEKDCQITATLRSSADGTANGYQGIIRDVTEIKKRQIEREKMIADLRTAIKEVKTLSGLLPICMHCKKIRDDKGYWNQIEAYISKHTNTEFSHSVCQECADKYYPDMDLYDDE